MKFGWKISIKALTKTPSMEKPMIGKVSSVTGLQKAKKINIAKAQKAVAAH